MKTFKLFGANITHKPIADLQAIKIKGFEYSKREVIDALIRMGYQIVKFKDYECAVKDAELPSDFNVWYMVGRDVLTVQKPALNSSLNEFKLNAQEYIIDEILEHLENGTVGQGISRSWECIKIDDSNLKFSLKNGCTFNPADLFWFGYLTPDTLVKS
jgi:hypothetical protein